MRRYGRFKNTTRKDYLCAMINLLHFRHVLFLRLYIHLMDHTQTSLGFKRKSIRTLYTGSSWANIVLCTNYPDYKVASKHLHAARWKAKNFNNYSFMTENGGLMRFNSSLSFREFSRLLLIWYCSMMLCSLQKMTWEKFRVFEWDTMDFRQVCTVLTSKPVTKSQRWRALRRPIFHRGNEELNFPFYY